ncbi:MAG: ribonuclease HII [Cyclobacteriaceae bacterium]|nr:ribonuclease HII [Cyclobacteriaceae bacterium]MCX7638535.1 ribonuclease HII [Cyclobacteriaceae bacterium]MDW8332225.1 ribonuclease HII [Cyclobacteriaceae bacterium]
MLLSSFTGKSDTLEAGCDEAGRGCLAGPVVAAAVILPHNYRHNLLNDSKQLTTDERRAVRADILRDAITWAVAEATVEEIDELNILNASFLAMHRAIRQLSPQPHVLVIDGNRFRPYENVPHHCVVKGDAKYLSVAAASVLAKVYRDELMEKLALEYPGYAWHTNKGYPTNAHRAAIRKLGVTSCHRKSFQLLPAQLELFEE